MFSWIFKSFKRQITIILFAFGLFTISSFLIHDYPKEKQQIREILKHQVSEFSTNLSLLITDDVRYSKYFILSDRLEKIYKNNLHQHREGLLFKIIQIAVLDEKNYIMGHTKPANYPLQTHYQHPDLPSLSANKIVDNTSITSEHIHNAIKWISHENRLLVRSPIILGNEIIGSVIVDADTSAIIALENALIEDILITFAILFIVVFILSHLSALWIGKPLQQIIKNIDSIGSGKLTLPFIKQRSDEFHILGSAIIDVDKRLFQKQSELMHEQSTLESKVKARTQELEAKTIELNNSLETLHQTQNELIESAKMASLGQLVAGVAHEINTPIGTCLTGASHVKDETRQLVQSLSKESLTEDQLHDYLSNIDQISEYMLISLNKASDLIRSFKQVSADQNIDEKHRFDLHEYINVILVSQQNMLKKYRVNIENRVPEELIINSYAGIFYQILTNFIANSLMHGYEKNESGLISISAEVQHHTLYLVYEDDGKGMDTNTLKKIFEPFFTTKRTSGGTGLGLHIIFNLVTHKLMGSIKAKSDINQGLRIDIAVPL